ncbi:uncharacterized protein LOC133792713 isoform X2 [Humulus lupulus]|uniref:uncharacterized protein LOC133792713 isoform X2 n=1 Tax=Humulus lupulus TaxID=3486 RepID=UPI002B404A8D|nr:uncharacterized protein LOC133792713 isoform X2 [Humulus lupulus]
MGARMGLDLSEWNRNGFSIYLVFSCRDCFCKTVFTTNKDYGKEEREAQWAATQKTLHGLQPPESNNIFPKKVVSGSFHRLQNKPSAGLRWQDLGSCIHSRVMLSQW